MGTMKWQPAWWNEGHASAWERVKEGDARIGAADQARPQREGAPRAQPGVADTVKQSAGKEALPPIDRANPPKVIGEWNDAELPVEYGYAARSHYSAHTAWTNDLETTLKTEWSSAKDKTGRGWEDVRDHVKYGFEAKH